MRRQDPTSHRQSRLAWAAAFLAALPGAGLTAVGLPPRSARAQAPPPLALGPRELEADAPAGPTPEQLARARDPIDLAGRRVSVWEQDGDQYALINGGAAVLQGVDGVRAETVVVRVHRVDTPQGPNYRIDAYAENVLPAEGRTDAKVLSGRTARVSFYTLKDVRLRPYDAKGLERRATPPPRTLTLARSQLLPAPQAPSPAPAATQAAQAAPAVPRARPVGVVATPPPRDASVTPTSTSNVVDAAGAAPGVRNPPQGSLRSRALKPVPPVLLPDLETPGAAGPGPAPGPAPGPGAASPPVPPPVDPAPAKLDPAVVPAQFAGPIDATDDPNGVRLDGPPPLDDGAEMDNAADVPTIPGDDDDARGQPPTNLAPLPAPGREGEPAPPANRRGGRERKDDEPAEAPIIPIDPGSRRVTRISPRNGGPDFRVEFLPKTGDQDTVVIRGGVNIVSEAPGFGWLDISADSAIIWRRVDPDGPGIVRTANGEEIDDAKQPMEVYLEGNVEVLQDERKVAGNGDQKKYKAKRAFYDIQSDRFVALDAELNMFNPTLVAPAKVLSPRIDQFRPLVPAAAGKYAFGEQEITAQTTTSTGSRFPHPGYRITSSRIDIYRERQRLADPNSGKAVGQRGDPDAPEDLHWWIDARQNFFYMGPVPVFYWPRVLLNADDLEPPLRQISFRTNNYFGQQLLTDFNGFRLFGLKKPSFVDLWNVDIDYLSARTKSFPALGTEIGWFGGDLINDLNDPYNKIKGDIPSFTKDYFGYFDVWGLRDYGRDILGAGPAVITDNVKAGNEGFQRGGGGRLGSVPPFQDFRGRFNFRHMQRFLPEDEEHLYEDFRLQVEAADVSDRHFLEEYYKRLFDVGLDQENLAYLIKQKDNTAWTLWTEATNQNWYTDTQWLPKFDYYRLGDSLVGNRLTYFQHSGLDYANTHTAVEVNNPHLFAFMPYDPVSNTSGSFSAGRFYTNHEVDLPLNFGNVVRVVPYLQGQAVGWTNQLGGEALGRAWGAYGLRADASAWKAYPWVQSELWNVHGLNHKIDVEADYRSAYSNVNLQQIAVQDDLDDNTYEFTRRYLALTNFSGGILPPQYDPRLLVLRRTLSPITGTTDVQATIETLHMGIHQRLQTKRGPEGKRRIIDYMTLDADTTYFPNAARDNFNTPFGQNTYLYQWFVGDRTSIVSNGWFEFFKIGGSPLYKAANTSRHNDPFGLNMITSGVSISRPPRGTLFVGYSIIDTGPLNTSALTTSMTYWLAPKWYGTYSTMYDFGSAILLSALFSVTRIGADYLTSVGLTVDPQRQSYQFAFQITPRISPSVKLGSGIGGASLDSRYAPTE